MINVTSDSLLDQYLERDRFNRFLDEVVRANQKFNLFSRNLTRMDLQVLAAESLIPLRQAWITDQSGPILDIGSGWGVPAIPLLLSGLKADITLLERSQKKADFLYLLLRQLNLTARVVCEDVRNYQEQFCYSLAILRGVALDQKLRRPLEKIIKPGGGVIYFGSNFPEEWLGVAQALDYTIDKSSSRKLIKYTFT